MEDALALDVMSVCMALKAVLILVLMEDALAQKNMNTYNVTFSYSLNPCFNGRCTRTDFDNLVSVQITCLNPCFNGRCTRTCFFQCRKLLFQKVLILVLMEDALARV